MLFLFLYTYDIKYGTGADVQYAFFKNNFFLIFFL